MNREYQNKLDEIIKFFDTKRARYNNWYNLLREERKFDYSNNLSIFAIIMAFSSSLFLVIPAYSILIVIIELVLFALINYFTNKNRKELNEKEIEKRVRYETLVNFFQMLKISGKEIELSDIIKKIESRYRDSRFLMENFEDVWTDEIITLVDAINNKMDILDIDQKNDSQNNTISSNIPKSI